jgi:cell division protein FtsQ
MNGQPTLLEELTSPSTPNKPSLKLTSDLVSSILALGAKMPADTTLVYDSEHGLGWNDPNGWEVFFGDEDKDMEMKVIVYQALVERLQSEGIQPVMISVEYVHAPYYRVQR